MKPVIIIPARLGSTRLPRKMLAEIAGKPLVVRCLECALAADIAPVYVACDSEEIAEVVNAAGGKAVITDPDLPSGSDRVFAASQQITDVDFDVIVNVQGDQPSFDPEIVRGMIPALKGADISTPVAHLKEHEVETRSVVKAIIGQGDRALYFTRSNVDYGKHHLGFYAYRKEALAKFVSLPVSSLEKSESLEQLRALDNGMTIKVSHTSAEPPISIDTPEDLERARAEIS